MASIIIMTSDDFLESFVKKYNCENYNFILVSSDIKTKHKYKNIYRIKQLLPPTKAVSSKLNGNDEEGYRKKYFKHLSRPDIEIYLTTIVRLAVAEDSNVVLLCSKDEHKSYKYLNLIREYLEEVYGVRVYTYKKYRKDKKPTSVTNKKKTLKIVAKKIELNAQNGTDANIDIEEFVGKLRHMKKKIAYNFAKKRGIKVKPDMSKKDIIKAIEKKLK